MYRTADWMPHWDCHRLLESHTTLLRGKTFPGAVCKNPNCITHTETYLPKSFISLGNSLLECEFCNERLLMEH